MTINTKTNTPLMEGLELQLQLLSQLEYKCDGDCFVCITCYQMEEECQCPTEEIVLWPLSHAVRMLATVIEDMGN